MLASTQRSGFGKRRKKPSATRTFLSTYNSETDATSYSASAVSIAAAAANKAIVVAVMNRVSSGTAAPPASVTVDGVAATMLASKGTASDRNCASLWIATVSTGSTGDIVVDFGGVTQQRCGFGWWAAYDLVSTAAASAPNSSDVSGAAIDVNTSAGGLVFGTGNAGQGAAATFTWTGLTEDFDIAVGSGNGWFTGASLATAAASTPLGITCTCSGTPSNDQYLAVSLR